MRANRHTHNFRYIQNYSVDLPRRPYINLKHQKVIFHQFKTKLKSYLVLSFTIGTMNILLFMVFIL